MGLTLSASSPRYFNTTMWFFLFATFLTAVAVQTGSASYGFFSRRAGFQGRSAPGSLQQSSSETTANTFYKKNSIWGPYGQSGESAGLSREDPEYVENKDCCPSVTELIHPLAGVSREGRILEIYRGENKTQKFYQTSCRRDIKDRPCRFVRSKYELTSRCKQEYSYTYAIVRNVNTEGQWRMDHIRVRSGCTCQIMKLIRARSTEARKKRK